MTSPICPNPPELTITDKDARVCSVDGYDDDLLSGIVAPGLSLPVGGWPSGGLSSKCIDPSRLVCPTLATALAGTTTSGLTPTSTSACQPCTVILATLPTTTSSIMTGEFDSMVPTLGISTWNSWAAGPRPTAPGSGSEFRPWNAHPVAVSTTHDPITSSRRAVPKTVMTLAFPRGAACRARSEVQPQAAPQEAAARARPAGPRERQGKPARRPPEPAPQQAARAAAKRRAEAGVAAAPRRHPDPNSECCHRAARCMPSRWAEFRVAWGSCRSGRPRRPPCGDDTVSGPGRCR